MTAMIDNIFVLERTMVRKCDKPWITSSIKKNSDIYEYWHNKVQLSFKTARKKYYRC